MAVSPKNIYGSDPLQYISLCPNTIYLALSSHNISGSVLSQYIWLCPLHNISGCVPPQYFLLPPHTKFLAVSPYNISGCFLKQYIWLFPLTVYMAETGIKIYSTRNSNDMSIVKPQQTSKVQQVCISFCKIGSKDCYSHGRGSFVTKWEPMELG